MAYFKDVREHLAALEAAHLLTRIDREINKDTQLNPLVRLQFRGLPEIERKAFLFTHVTDVRGRRFEIPVAVCHLAASRKIYAFGMQCNVDSIAQRWAEALKSPIDPVLISDGPVQEEVHIGEDLNRPGMGLEEFPIPISTPGFDAAPFTSAGHWITKDPETGIRNIGNYRGMVKSRTRIGMNAGGKQDITQHWRKWHKIGKPMPAAIAMGTQPNISYTSVVKIPYGVDDYAIAGALAGEPVKLVKAKTVDIEVPANAEIVIEGFLNTEYLEPEAPFGEYTGYMDPQQLNPFMDITCITHRRNPVLVTMLSQFPPSESSKIRAVGSEASVLSDLHRLGFQCVTNVAYNESSGSWGLCCIQLSKPKEGEAAAILEACSESSLIRGKIFILVDDDIDPWDMESVVWAMTYRMQPHRDIKIKPASIPTADWSVFPPGSGDPGGFESQGDTKSSIILVDATRKWAYPPVSLPSKEVMLEAVTLWQELALPALNLRVPWYGYELGWWTDAEREAGKLAIQGRYYETGARMMQRRVSSRRVNFE
jgi:4-hydroxy-3-polyprenylbenzoate decarboxylase